MPPELLFFKLKIFLTNSVLLGTLYFSPYYTDKLICEREAQRTVGLLIYLGVYSVEGGDLCWQGPIEAWDFENGWADNATEGE